MESRRDEDFGNGVSTFSLRAFVYLQGFYEGDLVGHDLPRTVSLRMRSVRKLHPNKAPLSPPEYIHLSSNCILWIQIVYELAYLSIVIMRGVSSPDVGDNDSLNMRYCAG